MMRKRKDCHCLKFCETYIASETGKQDPRSRNDPFSFPTYQFAIHFLSKNYNYVDDILNLTYGIKYTINATCHFSCKQ